MKRTPFEINLKAWLSSIMATVLLLANSGCDRNCASVEATLFYQYSRGTWRLVKLVSPSGTQTIFSQKQTLKIYPISGRLPGPNTGETILRDTTTAAKNEWLSVDSDCKNQSFVVTYDNVSLMRKYWVNEKRDVLQATGYVSQIGSKADTLMYYYEPYK